MFESLARKQNSGNDIFFEQDLFPKKIGENCVEEISKWIKEQPHYSCEKRTCGDELIEEETLVEVIEAVQESKKGIVKSAVLQVKPNLLFMPGLQISNKSPDPFSNHRLFDRIIIARNNYIVPLGYRGTIIGMHSSTDPNPIRQEQLKTVNVNYDILFDRSFDDGSDLYGIAEKRVYRVSETAFINISYGLAKTNKTDGNDEKVTSTGTNALNSTPTTKSNIANTVTAKTQPIDNGFSNIWEALKKNNVPQTIHIENSANKPDSNIKSVDNKVESLAIKILNDSFVPFKDANSEEQKTDMLKKMLGMKLNESTITVANETDIEKNKSEPIDESKKFTIQDILKYHVRNCYFDILCNNNLLIYFHIFFFL